MTDAVAVAAIHAAEIIIPSGISAYAALKAIRAAKNAAEAKVASAETKVAVEGVAHAMNSLLDKRVKEAGDLGEAKGNAAGVEQERKRHGDE